MQEQRNITADPHQRHDYGCECHGLDHTGVSQHLNDALQGSGDVVVSQTLCDGVSSSMLNEDELKQLEEACDMALELNQSKHRIYEYVESRMSFIAPNLSIIVGASTAAKIMGEFTSAVCV